MGKKHYLAAGLFFKNDPHYLIEWLEFHRIVGVEHFYLACNDDDPGVSLSLIQPYISNGLVTFVHLPGGPGVAKQLDAHDWFLQVADTKWLMVVDLDEFCFPAKEWSLLDVLPDYEHYGGVCACWLCYGSSGLFYPPDLVTESFIYRSVENFSDNGMVKSIIDPSRVDRPINPHTWMMKSGWLLVDELGRKVTEGTCGNFNDPVTHQRMRVNHYRIRSWLDFQAKCKRWQNGGHPEFFDGCKVYFSRYDHNLVVDKTIWRYLPELKRRLREIPQSNIFYRDLDIGTKK